MQNFNKMILHIQIIEKKRAVIEFEVNEDEVEAQWLKDGIEINFQVEERYRYIIQRRVHRMTITETRVSDSGEYVFVAGKNRSTVTLHINGMYKNNNRFLLFCNTFNSTNVTL